MQIQHYSKVTTNFWSSNSQTCNCWYQSARGRSVSDIVFKH